MDVFVSKTPIFLEKLVNVEMNEENIPLSLKCRVSGRPRPAVQWLHSDKAIPFNVSLDFCTSVNEISDNETEFSLYIRNFLVERHKGIYTAIASNLYGDAHSSSQVTLKKLKQTEKTLTKKEPNSFLEELSDQTVELGSDATFQCIIDKSKINNLNNVRVMWKRENTIIRPFLSRRFSPKFDKDNGMATLHIFSTELLDAGKYSVLLYLFKQ